LLKLGLAHVHASSCLLLASNLSLVGLSLVGLSLVGLSLVGLSQGLSLSLLAGRGRWSDIANSTNRRSLPVLSRNRGARYRRRHRPHHRRSLGLGLLLLNHSLLLLLLQTELLSSKLLLLL